MRRTARGEKIIEYEDIDSALLNAICFHVETTGTSRTDRATFLNDFFTMDIETTTIDKDTDEPIAFTYSIAVYIDDNCLLFRNWRQYNDFISRLTDRLDLQKSKRMVCYVHNLPYEFQFMRSFMHVTEVFATQKRKVVKFRTGGIEYRCSYKMTNMSLEKLTESTPNVTHGKLDGKEYNYNKLRTPKTHLTDSELDYIFNDVAGLYEAIRYRLENDKYNLATMPLTSTGFVRNKMRSAMNENPQNRIDMLDCRLDALTYGLLREARRGGNTHCSPVWSNEIIEDMLSMDMSSAYPAVMVQCKFPSTKFCPIKYPQNFEEYVDKGYACLIDITFHNICVNTIHTVPYIAKAKCTQIKKIVGDNGRVLCAKTLSMVITDIDYKIIRDTYKWDKDKTECRFCYISDYDYLPMEMRQLILKQYREKTTLKGKDDYLYMKKKNEFNANFGCMLTDICQDAVEYVEGIDGDPFKPIKVKDFDKQLEKYYKNHNSFLQYQHGVWVTAHCRNRLQKAIQGLGDDMVYCDTDSAKFYNKPVNRLLFDKLNEEILQEIEECGLDCKVEYNNKLYTLGVWEDDGHYKQFKSLGAKKYCYIDNKDDKGNKVNYDYFHITVAGLSKSKAREWLAARGGIKKFKPGTRVPTRHSGRTEAYYNDWAETRLIEIKGELIEVGSNIAIKDSPYTFGLTEDYEMLLINIEDGVIV